MSCKVFIDGSSGTTGLRIAERLARRPELELLTISEAGRKDLACRAEVINAADLAFLCLPDAASKEVIPLVDARVKVLDTSTAFRTAPGWVYGFPELHGQREAIRAANRVAVPGCHASGVIALARPLVELGLVPADYPFSCHSLTGYSGGGKKMIAEYKDAARPALYSTPRAYGLTLHHKHLPEMQAVSGLSAPPVFCPIVDDYYSGMEVTVPLRMELLPGVTSPCGWSCCPASPRPRSPGPWPATTPASPFSPSIPWASCPRTGCWPPGPCRAPTASSCSAPPAPTAARCCSSPCSTTSARVRRARRSSA